MATQPLKKKEVKGFDIKNFKDNLKLPKVADSVFHSSRTLISLHI